MSSRRTKYRSQAVITRPWRNFAVFAVAGWLAIATPPIAAAQDSTSQQGEVSAFAIFGPEISLSKIDSALADPVVTRARAALDRPPSPVASFHVEGTLPPSPQGAGGNAIPGSASNTVAGTTGNAPPGASGGGLPRMMSRMRDLSAMLDLALAWRIMGDHAFLNQADRYLDAWATAYQPSFNPIDEANFGTLIIAYNLTKSDLPESTRVKVDALLRRMATGYIEQMETRNVPIPQTLTINWQSHRLELATLASFQLGDTGLVDRVHVLFNKQIEANLHPDGSSLDFDERDALHYVTYDLEPLLVAALAAKEHGQDWYSWRSPAGSSLPNSLDWLSHFATGEKTHAEFVNSIVPFDRQRADAGMKTYQAHNWEPSTAVRTYELAAQIDPRFQQLRDVLIAKANVTSDRGPDFHQPDWVAFLAAVQP